MSSPKLIIKGKSTFNKMNKKETEILEFKKSTSELKESIKSICAILNKHKKGKLIFGIKLNGEVVGQDINEKTLRDISKAISDFIEPKIFPKIYEEIIDEKKCVIVDFEGLDIPYFAYGRAYIRVSDENKLLSAKELEKLILKKNKEVVRWDYEICEEANLKDISEERLKWFLEESNKDFEGVKNSLIKLGLIKEEKLRNSAILLFGKNTNNLLRNSKLRCAVFGTDDTSVDIDMQEFEGNLFDLIEEAEKYFLKNIHIGMKLEGLKRVDVSEINKEAFREAIINAFCHRDYFNPDSVHLAIFRDRVEIRSPGLLYGDLTIEKIREEKVSERRNELIAQMLHMIHFVENWGKGISKILKLEPKTDFKEIGRKFYTVFYRDKIAPQVTPQVTPQVKLTELECKILTEIKENPKLSRSEIAKKLGISSYTVKEYLSKLKLKGAIVRVGKTNAGHWEIN